MQRLIVDVEDRYINLVVDLLSNLKQNVVKNVTIQNEFLEVHIRTLLKAYKRQSWIQLTHCDYKGLKFDYLNFFDILERYYFKGIVWSPSKLTMKV